MQAWSCSAKAAHPETISVADSRLGLPPGIEHRPLRVMLRVAACRPHHALIVGLTWVRRGLAFRQSACAESALRARWRFIARSRRGGAARRFLRRTAQFLLERIDLAAQLAHCGAMGNGSFLERFDLGAHLFPSNAGDLGLEDRGDTGYGRIVPLRCSLMLRPDRMPKQRKR